MARDDVRDLFGLSEEVQPPSQSLRIDRRNTGRVQRVLVLSPCRLRCPRHSMTEGKSTDFRRGNNLPLAIHRHLEPSMPIALHHRPGAGCRCWLLDRRASRSGTSTGSGSQGRPPREILSYSVRTSNANGVLADRLVRQIAVQLSGFVRHGCPRLQCGIGGGDATSTTGTGQYSRLPRSGQS